MFMVKTRAKILTGVLKNMPEGVRRALLEKGGRLDDQIVEEIFNRAQDIIDVLELGREFERASKIAAARNILARLVRAAKSTALKILILNECYQLMNALEDEVE